MPPAISFTLIWNLLLRQALRSLSRSTPMEDYPIRYARMNLAKIEALLAELKTSGRLSHGAEKLTEADLESHRATWQRELDRHLTAAASCLRYPEQEEPNVG